MNAVRAGLTQDGFSWPFVLAVVAATIIGWLTIRIFQAREQREAETPTHVVNDCDRGGHYYTAHQMVWRCVNCGDRVPRNEIAYDQEQDGAA